MVKDCYEKILRDWDTLADDNDSELEENLATLTAQLVETFRDLQGMFAFTLVIIDVGLPVSIRNKKV